MSASKATAAAALIALLAAGCGGSDDTSSPSKDATPTAAEAAAAAKAINLVAADLPGFEGTAPEADDPSDAAFEKDFYGCLGLPTPTYVVETPGDDFTKGEPPASVEYSSEVDVVPSLDQVAKELEAFAGDKTSACLGTAFDKQIAADASGQDVTFGKLKVTKGTAPADGFAYEFAASVSAGGQSIPISGSIQGFAVKHTEVSLTTFAFGQPAPTAERDALLAKLRERATKSAV